MNSPYIDDLFHLPLSTQAHQEFLELEKITDGYNQLERPRNSDSWTYIWGNDNFSSAKAYKAMVGINPSPPHFKWIWKTSCQPKHKVFF